HHEVLFAQVAMAWKDGASLDLDQDRQRTSPRRACHHEAKPDVGPRRGLPELGLIDLDEELVGLEGGQVEELRDTRNQRREALGGGARQEPLGQIDARIDGIEAERQRVEGVVQRRELGGTAGAVAQVLFEQSGFGVCQLSEDVLVEERVDMLAHGAPSSCVSSERSVGRSAARSAARPEATRDLTVPTGTSRRSAISVELRPLK